MLRKTLTEKENDLIQMKQDSGRQISKFKQQQQQLEKQIIKLQDNYQTQLQFKASTSIFQTCFYIWNDLNYCSIFSLALYVNLYFLIGQ